MHSIQNVYLLPQPPLPPPSNLNATIITTISIITGNEVLFIIYHPFLGIILFLHTDSSLIYFKI